MPKDKKAKESCKKQLQGSPPAVDQGANEFRNFMTSNKMKLIHNVDSQSRTVTFYAAEDRGEKLFQLSQKEIRTAKKMVDDMFRPDHSIDGGSGTIWISEGYRLDLQGYIANKFGARWANVALQYGYRPKSGMSSTYAQVMIPVPDGSNGFCDYSHHVRVKALKLSLDHHAAIWVRTIPATVDEIRCPVRDDFQQCGGKGR